MNLMEYRPTSLNPRSAESGTTLLEVMISAFLLTIALLAAALTVAAGISSMYISQEQLIAKQKAREAVESVFTARSTQNIVFNQIRNVSDATVYTPAVSGIFLDGWQPITGVGADGMTNTADDPTTLETIMLPGPDGMLGTSDDDPRPLNGFQRRVTINHLYLPNTNIDPDIRQMIVEVRFQVRGIWRMVTVSSLISRFS